MKILKNDIFIKACKRKPVERTPIWVMRQAGRYLPEYREIRKKYDFLTMCKTPELASEVTIQPVNLINVDAAILFSDILVIPEAMGLELKILENKGPVFLNPVRDKNDFLNLKKIDPFKDLKYVLDSITITKNILNGEVPLIGFSGSPWTLLTYMIEGGSSKNFGKVKKLIYDEPDFAHLILDFLADAVTDYLNAKIETGVDAVQIFDTWGGILSPDMFNEFSLNYIKKIISGIKIKDKPVIVFSKGAFFALENIAESGADVIGLDWTSDIGNARKRIGEKAALQGNLDPAVLYANINKIKKEASKIIDSFGYGSGHIFNLGHGIHPDTNPDNLKELVRFVKQYSVKYHKSEN